MDRALIAADFHLDGSEVARARLAALLEIAADERTPLFLLGDLFHYWFGRRHLELAMYAVELDLLTEAVNRGVKIYLWPGNRDFLLDRTFTRRTGIWVGGDASVIRVGEQSVHLSHGDLLCTDDLNYQAMRKVIRSAPIRFLAHRLPSFLVNHIAGRLRAHSERVVAEKPMAVLEPDRSEILALFGSGHDVVVCGHFHRFRDQRFESPHPGRFIILEPFEDRGGYARCSAADGWSFDCVPS